MAADAAELRRRAVERGVALVDRVEPVAEAVWSVPSQTEAGVAYVVALVGGRLRCECPSGVARGICAHAAAVALALVAGPAAAAEMPSNVIRMPERPTAPARRPRMEVAL